MAIKMTMYIMKANSTVWCFSLRVSFFADVLFCSIRQITPLLDSFYVHVKTKFRCLSSIGPHCGLPPCCGGGAYAPRTRTICNLKERSLLTADRMIRTTILHVISAKWLVNFRLHSRSLWPLVTSGLRIGPNWYGLSAGQVQQPAHPKG